MVTMRSVGLKTLSRRLRRYVRLAAAGETVLITDGERVVAEIVPPRPERSSLVADVLLAETVRNGLLAPPAMRGKGPPSKPPPVMALNELLAGLDADREDR